MIRPPPPCAIICLAAICVPKNALLRLIARTLSYCSSVVFEDGRAGLDAGIVDHDVDAAEFRHRGIDQRLQLGDAADVGLDADGRIAQRGDLALERVGRLGVGHDSR